jgi:dephospho-CoA kinase
MVSKILVISGFDRSGKSSAAEISRGFGFTVFECGLIVRNSINSTKKIDISNYYQRNMNALNSIIYSEIKMKAIESNLICIVGVRSFDLLKLLKENFPSLKLLFIESDQLVRFQRHLKSGGASSPKTFQSVDDMQIKWGLCDIRKNADFEITNNDTSNNFSAEVKKVLNQI